MTKHRFHIKVKIKGGLSDTQVAVFEQAAAFWSRIIVADVPGVRIGTERIDDVVIDATGTIIDGESGILGQAGPTFLRPGSLIPAKGEMEFDRADLTRMEVDGSLQNVIVHEMGHVLGIGTLWDRLGLLAGAGTANPRFIGPKAMAEFGRLLGNKPPTPVPVENTGGPGTREGHWRESVFGSELMTGFLDTVQNPMSRVTIASLEDLGYGVEPNSADAFTLPTHLELSMLGIWGENHDSRCHACGHRRRRIEPIVLPESCLG